MARLMSARYLRVVNREKFQHYKDRCPPWIKVHRALITGEDKQLDDVLLLEEWEQYQLLRIWVLASQCDAFLLAFDERWVRRAIRTTRKVPLEKFVRQGFLEVLSEDEADAARAEWSASKSASAPLANPGVETGRDASALANGCANTPARRAGTEKTENSEVLTMDSGRHFENRDSLPETINPENQFLTARLIAVIGDHADRGTSQVVAGYADRLPPAALNKVIESLELGHPLDRAAYAVGALRSEIEERAA